MYPYKSQSVKTVLLHGFGSLYKMPINTLKWIQGICCLCCFAACSAPVKSLFSKSTPHEVYSNRLTSAGLNTTALGRAWLSAADNALKHPVNIQLPFKETGYFAAEQPFAAGYIFGVKRGQKINISISTNPPDGFLLFADLWRADSINPKLLQSADTARLTIEYDADENANYQLRIQPELLKSGTYTLTITQTGSLAFPVPSEDNPKIGSFWGDSRDQGARKHEGIDIFGKFRTPVVAAADGYITNVGENNLGGKVVFLRPSGKDYTLYYAHLDSQIAREGESLKAGDMIGLMGNTGNAKYTPTHLHFGIYTFGGAIDPLPFVDQRHTQPENITASLQSLGGYVKTVKTATVYTAPSNKATGLKKINPGTALYVTAANGNWYKIILPEGNEAFINANTVSAQLTSARTYTTDSPTLMLDDPLYNSSPKKIIEKGNALPVYGSYNNFYLVEYDGLKGWIKE